MAGRKACRSTSPFCPLALPARARTAIGITVTMMTLLMSRECARRRTRLPWSTMVPRAAAALLLLLAGCYRVEVAPCQVRCSNGTHDCPTGMSCGTDDFCHARGDDGQCAADGDGGL